MRGQTAMRLAAMLRARGQASAFPSAEIALDGWMENALMSEPATAVEDRYRDILRKGRARDAIAGRTLDGPHLTDLQVIYAPKNMTARDASTGEQKALLIGLVLAHAGLVAEMIGITPLLLLDEVVAHLDPRRRVALFDELSKLGAQVWMTGADPAAFADIGSSGEIFGADSWKRGAESVVESRFLKVLESAFRGLEKSLKIPIFSISCGSRLCARRAPPFMAEIDLISAGFAPL